MRKFCLFLAVFIVQVNFLFGADKFRALGPLPLGDQSSNPQGMIACGGGVYFTADDGVNGRRLWRSDGTADGTQAIDVVHGTLTAEPLFGGCDGLVYYVTQEAAEEGKTRYYVECSDGTAAGTKSLLTWVRSTSTASNAHFVNHVLTDGETSRQAVVFAGGEPSRLDELTGGTVANAVSDSAALFASLSSVPIDAQQMLYITTSEGFYETSGLTLSLGTLFAPTKPECMHRLSGNQLIYQESTSSRIRVVDRVSKVGKWLANGTKTFVVCPDRIFYVDKTDNTLWAVNPGATAADTTSAKIDTYPVVAVGGKDLIAATGNTVFAVRNEGNYGSELWKIDQNKQASLVKDLTSGNSGSTFQALAAMGGNAFFLLKNVDGFLELWKSDGTAAGTQVVRRMNLTAINTGEMAVEGTRLFLTGEDLYGREPWISDGTAAGTQRIKNLSQAPLDASANARSYFGFATTDGESLFTGEANGNLYLLKSDGTTAGTTNLGCLGLPPRNLAGTGSVIINSVPVSSAEVPNGVYAMFSPYMGLISGASGTSNLDRLVYYEVSSQEARDLGTYYRSTYSPGPNISGTFHMTTVGNQLLFTDTGDDLVYQLYRSNGTPAGTVPFSINPAGCMPEYLGQLGSTHFYAAEDATHGRELWRTNGSESGTKQVKDIVAGAADGFPVTEGGRRQGVALGNFLYFSASTPATGYELWRTNGSEAGTTPVKEICPGTPGSSPGQFARLGDKIIFSAFGVGVGTELFVSDGTANGTQLLKDINPGENYSAPLFLCQHNDLAYYTATTAAEGAEVWRTDGTTEGTFILGDLVPGDSNSSRAKLRGMTRDRMFFAIVNTLYASDGTVEGTYSLGTTNADCDVVDNIFYFVQGTALCRSDGTPNGTYAIGGLPFCRYLEGHAGQQLLFYGYPEGGANQLYAYDTTTEAAARNWEGYK